MCLSKPTMKVLCEVPFKDKTITELDVSAKNLGTEGALVVSYYLENNGALEKLRMAENKNATKEVGEAIGRALAQNSVLKVLDISGDGYFCGMNGTGFAKGIAYGIKNNRALTSLNLSHIELCCIDEDGCSEYDASAMTAFADAIGKNQ